jgi:hypothetical protein
MNKLDKDSQINRCPRGPFDNREWSPNGTASSPAKGHPIKLPIPTPKTILKLVFATDRVGVKLDVKLNSTPNMAKVDGKYDVEEINRPGEREVKNK